MDYVAKEIKINFTKFDGENFLNETMDEYQLGQVIEREDGYSARCYRKEEIDGDLVQFFEIGNLMGEFQKDIQK